MGQVSAHSPKYESEDFFIKFGSVGRNTVQEIWQPGLWLFSEGRVLEKFPVNNGR